MSQFSLQLYVEPRRLSRSKSDEIQPKRRRRSDVPWQAKYKERQKRPPINFGPKQDLSAKCYQSQFYGMLWLEEQEHMEKLKMK